MTALTSTGDRAAWQRASNILAVRLDNLGDVLMTTPALTALWNGDDALCSASGGEAGGARRITLLASAAGAAAAGHVPAIAEVITFEAPWTAGAGGGPQAERRLVATLARRRFDAAVIFTVCTQSALPAALVCRMAGVPLRLAHSRENPYALLTDWVRDTEVVETGMRHEVQRQLDLVGAVGFEAANERLVFEYGAAERARAWHALAAAGGTPERPWIVVHPGSSAASRRYPPERFGQAARAIAERCGAQIVFSGGPDEIETCARAQQAMGLPSVSLAGRLSVGELAALIGGARLILCNNSGPAHLAAALGTPSVVLYALTNPQHTPWRASTRVLNRDVACRNCLKSVCPEGHHACLLGVPPEEVAQAALALWHAQPAPLQPAAPTTRVALAA